MANFKTVEVKGFTKQEAWSKAPFQVIKDATQKWKLAGCPHTGAALKDFCSEYLQANTKFAAGVGCAITVEAGSADTRENPYTVENVKNTKGKRGFKTGYQAINPATGEILFTNFQTKADAIEQGKDLYRKKGYRGEVVAKYIHEVVEGEPLAFKISYTPSKSANEGSYIVFGVEA